MSRYSFRFVKPATEMTARFSKYFSYDTSNASARQCEPRDPPVAEGWKLPPVEYE
jgi:hypothetical protein